MKQDPNKFSLNDWMQLYNAWNDIRNEFLSAARAEEEIFTRIRHLLPMNSCSEDRNILTRELKIKIAEAYTRESNQ